MSVCLTVWPSTVGPEGRRRARVLIRETTRAEMSAHDNCGGAVAAGAGERRDAPSDDGLGGATARDDVGGGGGVVVGPYERRLRRLDEARARRLELMDRNDDAPRASSRAAAVAESFMEVGELHYELGLMEDSQDMYTEALKRLLDLDDGGGGSQDGDGDGDDDDDYDRRRRMRMMVARCAHSLGAVHARCGEYDEARRWYEESLRKKREVLGNNVDDNGGEGAAGEDDDDDGHAGGMTSSSAILRRYRYELGKTYNGLAALEAMGGGDAGWDEAMSLFREAERNYVYGYEEQKDDGNDRNESEATEGTLDLGVLAATQEAPVTRVTKAALHRMSPRRVESLVDVRSNMAELSRQRGRHETAVDLFRSALDVARTALEHAHEKKMLGDGGGPDTSAVEDDDDGPGPDERRNAIVDLLAKIGDALASAKKYDGAAEAYEQALDHHVHFRKWIDNDHDEVDASTNDGRRSHKPKSVLPPPISIAAEPADVEYDLVDATSMEAAIRHNLARALAEIGQHGISQRQFEASLTIKRRLGGDNCTEVARTLMGLGALAGGPLRDFARALNCFKEALFIYRANLEELSGVGGDRGTVGGSHEGCGDGMSSSQALFGEEDAEEIDFHIQNALKNIGLIEAAMMKDAEGKSKRRRR